MVQPFPGGGLRHWSWTWAGQLIGASILPILEVGEGGSRVTPPMTLETNWVTLAGAYVVLAAVTAATVLWLAWLTSRMEVHQVLRAGRSRQVKKPITRKSSKGIGTND